MVLNANSILKFIPGGLGDFGAKAQCGIDLSIKNIRRIKGGKIFQDGKEIDEYEEVDTKTNEKGNKVFALPNGVYSLEFDQDIKLDNKHCGYIKGRSTTNRCGCYIWSGEFDPGFECPSIGATMLVAGDNLVEIEEHSRLAQLILEECEESEEYNGSYKGNKDIK
jgi:deoxycytidine triphosphate deaminase